jgi:hypothetical protein
MLATLRSKLTPTGLLLIQTPDATRNPFDLIVADHSIHFSPDTLATLVRRTGFDLVSLSTEWVSKELSLVAGHAGARTTGEREIDVEHDTDALPATLARLEWLRQVAHEARRLAQRPSFGIFGTSIAGAWLFGELGGAVDFFVDEDESRVGRSYMGRPIYAPRDVPETSEVFLGLATAVADGIYRRLSVDRSCSFRLHLPPPLAGVSVAI